MSAAVLQMLMLLSVAPIYVHVLWTTQTAGMCLVLALVPDQAHESGFTSQRSTSSRGLWGFMALANMHSSIWQQWLNVNAGCAK